MTKPCNEGRACNGCNATEARCAFAGTCCSACSHFRHLDAAGNDKPKLLPNVIPIDNRRTCGTCGTCGRRVSPRGRFDCPGLCASLRRAYDRDRYRSRAS